MKGQIRERWPGHWAIVLDVCDPATGKRKRKWHSFRGTKREAQNQCSRLITEFMQGTYLEPSKVTVSEFLEKWLGQIEPRVAPRTLERYQEIARKNIVPLLGQSDSGVEKSPPCAGVPSILLAGSFRWQKARNRQQDALD
jgi:Phage integrase, N-terminal SAM-like domain